jgi:hypothetical protein
MALAASRTRSSEIGAEAGGEGISIGANLKVGFDDYKTVAARPAVTTARGASRARATAATTAAAPSARPAVTTAARGAVLAATATTAVEVSSRSASVTPGCAPCSRREHRRVEGPRGAGCASRGRATTARITTTTTAATAARIIRVVIADGLPGDAGSAAAVSVATVSTVGNEGRHGLDAKTPQAEVAAIHAATPPACRNASSGAQIFAKPAIVAISAVRRAAV